MNFEFQVQDGLVGHLGNLKTENNTQIVKSYVAPIRGLHKIVKKSTIWWDNLGLGMYSPAHGA